MINISHIRNFCIIAHIDHGKSTLADRMLELTGTIEARKMRSQFLDQMELERERGITIKMQPVRMNYQLQTINYQLNLIDTPGHIDFNYEVSRALLAVEGVILLVDATQGAQAQTITNLELAQKHNLAIIPVINKIDLPDARIEETKMELVELLGCNSGDILLVSAKTGDGVEHILDAIIERIPCPGKTRGKTSDVRSQKISDVEERVFPREGKMSDVSDLDVGRLSQNSFQALIFDSQYSPHKGVIAHVRVFSGSFLSGKNNKLHLFHKKLDFEPIEAGIFTPALHRADLICAGEIGYIATNIKDPELVRVGDTIGHAPIAGYKEPKPVVWASFFPADSDEFDKLKQAVLKLKLNDPALSFDVESAAIFGRALRIGFLGLLHLEITAERLRREFDIEIVVAQPTVEYEIIKHGGSRSLIREPAQLGNKNEIFEVREQWFSVSIVSRMKDLGSTMEFLKTKEGEILDTKTIAGSRIMITALVPLRKVVSRFFDDLKSVTEGYGSMSYEFAEMRHADIEVIRVLIAEEEVLQFARLVTRVEAEYEARKVVEKLYDLLPKQVFALKIQAMIGSRIVASRTLSALAKNVTSKLYGGDRTRKMKLWKKQKEGKRRLQKRGKIDIPQNVFLEMIK